MVDSGLLLALTGSILLIDPTIAIPDPSVSSVSNQLPGSQVVCSPTNWYDIVWFYFANYILHALSVRSLPGEELLTSIAFKFACLIVPYTGIRRGLCLIARAANLARNDLQSAARANALCMIVRTHEWKPMDGEEIDGCTVERPVPSASEATTQIQESAQANSKRIELSEIKTAPTCSTTDTSEDGTGTVSFRIIDTYKPPTANGILEKIYRIFVQTYKFSHQTPSRGRRLDPDDVKVHGLCKLAPGYGLSYVPEDMKIYPRYRTDEPDRVDNMISAIHDRDISALLKVLTSGTRLASTQNAPRILFSFIQTISGGYSLYRAQGKQIDRYGYAAYGLTVLPYMIVSVINFAGSLLSSEYEMVYMIHSRTMEEMIHRGGIMDGVIGSLECNEESRDLNSSISEERVIPEGVTLTFHNAQDSKITYRDLNSSQPPSDALCVNPPPPSKKTYMGPALEERGWYQDIYPRRKRKRLEALKKKLAPLPNTTIISIPAHDPFTHLPLPIYEPFLHVFTIALLIAAVAVPYITIYLLTGFHENQSTNNQRNFTLNWLIFGQIMGYGAGNVEKLQGRKYVLKGLLFVFVSYGTYCISGFVTVAQEMLEIGKCTAI